MSFILGLLGACLGIILAVAIIIGIILISLNKHLGAGSLKQILHAARNAKDIRKQEYSRIKNVSGMTKLMEPLILRDFNDFNKDMLYKEIENNLIKIFNAIENKSETQIKNDKALSLVYPQVLEQIQDMKSRSISEIQFICSLRFTYQTIVKIFVYTADLTVKTKYTVQSSTMRKLKRKCRLYLKAVCRKFLFLPVKAVNIQMLSI